MAGGDVIGWRVWVVVVAIVATACGGDGGELATPATAATTAAASSTTTLAISRPSEPAPTSSVVVTVPQPILPPSVGVSSDPVDLVPEVQELVAHDPASFTQGLVIEGGRMFESAGQYGESTLREVDPLSGEVLRSMSNDPTVFAEGLEVMDGELIQLTWREQTAFVWDVESFELVGTFDYEGEGWGLCSDGTRLVMSDGSDRLMFRNPEDFTVMSTVRVARNGDAVDRLNELECVEGYVLANVWRTSEIVVIDPADGHVVATIDAGALVRHVEQSGDVDVLNGIAYDDGTGFLHLTGKYWPTTFVVTLAER